MDLLMVGTVVLVGFYLPSPAIRCQDLRDQSDIHNRSSSLSNVCRLRAAVEDDQTQGVSKNGLSLPRHKFSSHPMPTHAH